MTRIRPDKQIQSALGQGYILHSDNNGELQYALLSALLPPAGNNSIDVKTIDSIALNGSILALTYTDNTNVQFTRSCNLSSLAIDVNLEGAILQHPDANTYILELKDSDGSKVNVNLSDLLAIVTNNSADIQFTGNGTAANPLTATLSDETKAALKGNNHFTDEFIGLTSGNSIQLSYVPVYPYPLHVYRNGLRQKENIEWRKDATNPKMILMEGYQFGANAQPETIIVDYMTKEEVRPIQG